MLEKLISAAQQVALDTDMRLLEEAQAVFPSLQRDSTVFRRVWLLEDRFVITSISRGSVLIEGGILLGIVWAVKNFIVPGWNKSETKMSWDEWVAGTIDKAAPILIEGLSKAGRNLKRLKVRKIVEKKDFDAEPTLALESDTLKAEAK